MIIIIIIIINKYNNNKYYSVGGFSISYHWIWEKEVVTKLFTALENFNYTFIKNVGEHVIIIIIIIY